MHLLLDTHVLLWWLTNSPRLPARCAAWIEDRANDVAISPVSAYEMRFKANKGLLPVSDALIADVPRIAAREGFKLLPLIWHHPWPPVRCHCRIATRSIGCWRRRRSLRATRSCRWTRRWTAWASCGCGSRGRGAMR